MAKVKTTVRFEILEFLDRFVDNATANDIGRTVVESAKEMIAGGQAPIRGGNNRFESYKAQAKRSKKGYPYNVMKKYPGKKVRPVNLELSGSMLADYTFTLLRPNVIGVGIDPSLGSSDKNSEIAKYHQNGTDKMAKRQIIPNDNQEWAVSIMRAIKEIYGKRLADLIRRSNKKTAA